MKKIALITSTLMACGLISAARAQSPVPVYITGSTAFRSQAVDGILGLFDGGAATNTVTRGNADPHSASYAILMGNIGGVPYHVLTLWSGSEAGLAALSGNTVPDTDFNGNPVNLANSPAFFLKDDGTVTGTSSSAPGVTETNTVATLPDLAMADTSKAVSFSKASTIVDVGTVGIVPFTWVKCTNSAAFPTWSNLVNVSHYQLKSLLGGPQQAGFFTGKSSDTNVSVFATGRNIGSGTRVNTLADMGYGIANTVDQWAINPKETSPGSGIYTGGFDGAKTGVHLIEIGNAGFESGGDVSKELSVDGCASAVDPITGNTGVITIGALGISDASANSLGTNLWLTLNGVFESDGAIAEGQYSFWGHEHLYRKAGLSGSQLTYAGNLLTAIRSKITGNAPTAHSKAISLSFMHCDKGSDTAFPTRF